MEYAMPLVDDLLTELESFLWFCSLDAASCFWAVMMTERARHISAFVCALGHFEWLRMPFGLNYAPMIYQRLVDNALWGYVQPKGGWTAYSKKMQVAEIETASERPDSPGGLGEHKENMVLPTSLMRTTARLMTLTRFSAWSMTRIVICSPPGSRMNQS